MCSSMKTAHVLALDDDRLGLAGRERIVAQPLHEVVPERRELGGGEDFKAERVGHGSERSHSDRCTARIGAKSRHAETRVSYSVA